MTRPAGAFEVGDEPLSGYRVVDWLQLGGTYETYEVWSQQRFASCVLKTIRSDRLQEPSPRRRLLREGRLLRRLVHPHIVRAYEISAGDRPAVVLETLGGSTLGHVLSNVRNRLGIADVAELGVQLTSALRYLHGTGYLHMDLKPNNIIIDGGRVKLIDLSLAQRPGHTPRGLGTAAYLSPEQARGGVVTTAADVWGLGVVLYEAATGTNPFRGPRSAEVSCSTCARSRRYLQLTERPQRSSRRRRLPGSLADAIDGCLMPDAADRPSLADLDAVWRQLGQTT